VGGGASARCALHMPFRVYRSIGTRSCIETVGQPNITHVHGVFETEIAFILE